MFLVIKLQLVYSFGLLCGSFPAKGSTDSGAGGNPDIFDFSQYSSPPIELVIKLPALVTQVLLKGLKLVAPVSECFKEMKSGSWNPGPEWKR